MAAAGDILAVTERSHKPRAYYFGCWDPRHAGHGFHIPGGASARSAYDAVPWSVVEVDGALAPRVTASGEATRRDPECSQGVARLHHRDGWTALSFWDRTGDSRPGSHSTFLLERDDASFDEMVAMARERFPQIMGRLPFVVVSCRRNDEPAPGRRKEQP